MSLWSEFSMFGYSLCLYHQWLIWCNYLLYLYTVTMTSNSDSICMKHWNSTPCWYGCLPEKTSFQDCMNFYYVMSFPSHVWVLDMYKIILLCSWESWGTKLEWSLSSGKVGTTKRELWSERVVCSLYNFFIWLVLK